MIVENIIDDAKNDGMGGDGMFTTGETIAIDATVLFDHADVAGLTSSTRPLQTTSWWPRHPLRAAR